jgi:abequosyltransferase
MKTPLLSICIATYNRASYIGETLDSIIPQLNDDVEILVVDGASTDNTENIMQSYVSVDPRIRYIRLSSKGGVDQDYDKSVEFSRGEYCWLFTDDDLLKSGAIAAVKAAIKEGYDLLVVNAEVRNRDMSVLLERQRIVIEQNKIFAPGSDEQLFIDSLHYLSFIGAVVIRRSIWVSRDRESYFGTEFVHVGVIFQQPMPGFALIIAQPFISIRLGNAQWTPRSFDIWMFRWPKLVWSFNHISEQAKQSVYSREPWRNLRTLIVHRSAGSYSIQTYRQYLSAMRAGALWKCCAWLIASSPQKIFIGIHYLYSRIRGPESRAFFDTRT